MNKKIFSVFIIASFISLLIFGCSASNVEERRGEISKEKQEIDTITVKTSDQSEITKEPDVPSKVDTNEIENEGKINPPVTEENVFYTVQLGAFQKISNVEKFEKIIKSKFSNLPIKTEQDPNNGYYKVTVGKFNSKDEAYRLRDYCVQQGYKDAWVTEIPK